MNLILGIISIILIFSIVVLLEKFFKKEGLYIWISFSVVIANIIACKCIDIFGFTTSLGNVMFASIFLATDILNEKYSSMESKKSIILAVIFQIIFNCIMFIGINFIPSEIDLVNGSMRDLFSINIRVSISSILMFLVSNMLDIFLFDKIKGKYPNQLWLRNNISTIISNCLENYLFIFLAFIGIYDLKTIFKIATVTSVIEIFIAICDTPFIYLSKHEFKINKICD